MRVCIRELFFSALTFGMGTHKCLKQNTNNTPTLNITIIKDTERTSTNTVSIKEIPVSLMYISRSDNAIPDSF